MKMHYSYCNLICQGGLIHIGDLKFSEEKWRTGGWGVGGRRDGCLEERRKGNKHSGCQQKIIN